MVSSKGRIRLGFRSAVPGIALLLMIAVAGVGNTKAATTHYISASGSDANSGISKTAPWAHLPGMASCGSNCSSYSPAAGDQFILKGCDVWVNSDLPVRWNWSGSSGNPIAITVDKTWFNTSNCPSSWNRPVFDAQNSAVSGSVLIRIAPDSTTSYITIDNIEIKRMGGSGVRMLGCYNTCSFFTFSNNYFHAWDMATDDCSVIQLGAGTQGGTITQNVIDGSDRTGASGGTCYGIYTQLPTVFSNNVIHDVPNAIVGYANSGGSATISGNLIYNILDSNGGANHANAMEIIGGGTYYIHDNITHDIMAAGAESLMLGNSGETSYVWNNLIYNIAVAQTPSFPQTSGQGAIPGLFFWNNTIVKDGQSCFGFSNQPGATFGSIVIQNNHCISNSSVYGAGASVTTLVTTPNVLMSSSAATNEGYTPSESYVYSPTSGSVGTVGAGTNLTGRCSGNTAALCNDTTYSCTQQTVNGVIQAVCPARTVGARPGSGAWDVGAYEYVSGGGPPNPPTGLTAVVQ
jgi:hypothetical protein